MKFNFEILKLNLCLVPAGILVLNWFMMPGDGYLREVSVLAPKC